MKNIYIVTAQHNSHIWEKISQEGYKTLKEAQDFIKNRSDKPIKKCGDFIYKSSETVYRIYEIQVKNS